METHSQQQDYLSMSVKNEVLTQAKDSVIGLSLIPTVALPLYFLRVPQKTIIVAMLMCAVIIYCTIWQTKTARTRFIINCIVAMLTIPIGVLLMHTMLLPVTLIIVYSALYSILTFEVINA